jgi:hypothetical protein
LHPLSQAKPHEITPLHALLVLLLLLLPLWRMQSAQTIIDLAPSLACQVSKLLGLPCWCTVHAASTDNLAFVTTMSNINT